MINFGYFTWLSVVDDIKTLSGTHGQYFMQLFPFYNCNDLSLISSEEYYNKYIKSGCFMLNDNNYIMSDNYCIKKDGSFRNRYVISPIFYIYYICLGYYVNEKAKINKNNKIDVFYSGDFDKNELHYLNSYKRYMNKITNNSYQYNKYIKLDIQNFYSSIDFRSLKKQLKLITNLTDTEIYVIENFLQLIGNNRFPETELGTTSAFLSTMIYLNRFDNDLIKYLENMEDISGFHCVRYVDDLFIFFNKSESNKSDNFILNKICNYINTELFNYKISLNKQKSKINDTTNIYEDIKMVSFLDEESLQNVSIDFATEEIISGFFEELEDNVKNNGINYSQYSKLIDKYFENKDSKYFASQIYQSFCFNASNVLISNNVKEKISSILDYDYKILSHDPKTLVSLIINTGDGNLIKTVLNKSFIDFRNGDWDIYNMYIIFQYLLRRKFRHKDLIRIIRYSDNKLYEYIDHFCINDWARKHNTRFINVFVDKCYSTESKISFLYFMYKKEYILDNIIPAFSYFKNYFDMLTGHFAQASGRNKKFSTQYYKEGPTKHFYKKELPTDYVFIENTIKNANALRNSNPICHGSGELLNDLSQKQTIDNSISDLNLLIKKEMYTNFNM